MRISVEQSPTYLVYRAEQVGEFVDTETFIWPEKDPRSIMCRDQLLETWSGPTEVLYWGTDQNAANEALSKVRDLPRLVEEVSLG